MAGEGWILAKSEDLFSRHGAGVVISSLFGILCLLSAASVVARSPGHALPDSPRTDAVVGSGTPASCTETDFGNALDTVQASGDGTITFNCGGSHAILFTGVRVISTQVIIDGGSAITLSGGNATRLFFVQASGFLELRNITLSNGYRASGDGGAIANVGTLHLDNATFRNNRTSIEGGSGGAIVSEGPITAVNSRFENNSSANGGAVYLRFEPGVGTFTNTTFKDNKTLSATNGWGGAILLWDGAQLTVRGCDFEGNSARRGGAIHNQFANVELVIEQGTVIRSNSAIQGGGGIWVQAGTTVIDRSTISSNDGGTSWGGGGIRQWDGTLAISASTIEGNFGSPGGGIYINGAETVLDGVTLAGNEASSRGGGIYFSGNATLSIRNSTLSGNTAVSDGGAIYVRADGFSTQIDLRYVTIASNEAYLGAGWYVDGEFGNLSLVMVNTVLANNISPAPDTCRSRAVTSTSARYSLWTDTSCSFSLSEQNHPNTPANLGPLTNNGGPTLTHAPLPGSLLIDNGVCLASVTTDQRGANRLYGPACDIGSVEVGAALPDSIFADSFHDALAGDR